MAIPFFNSWPLWEKMTFVLGVAILTVFGVGLGKLLWTNRFMRKHRLLDEEKQLRTQELRMSTQYLEAQKSQEVPFGIRAIQSGLQIDGIWISRNNSPVSSRTPSLSGDLADPPSAVEHVLREQSARELCQAASEPSNRGRPSLRQSDWEAISSRPLLGNGHSPLETTDQMDCRSKYKPRRSSRLRFGTSGGYHEDTLNQLEGKTPLSCTGNVQGALSPPESENGLLSTANVDHGRRRGSISDESEGRPSSSAAYRSGTMRQSFPHFMKSRGFTSLERNTLPPKRTAHRSFPMQNSGPDYFAVALSPPEDEFPSPLVTPPSTPLDSQLSPETQTAQSPSGFTGSEVQTLSQISPPFVSGELHMNRTVRKINSGFEVLPAGTFGPTVEPTATVEGAGGRRSRDTSIEPRKRNKLQKRSRGTSTTRGTSSTRRAVSMSEIVL